uniref:CBF1-interacting co-repressor CIR N-terminal domain-containing protein n=1 Tax=Chaetoceros debilis TaxID=122233 RepID=A0A7S3PXM0_9STRA
MSGRLIISGKKSYTPWNSRNIERVLRDERLERERIENEEQKSRKNAMEQRIRSMREHNGHECVMDNERKNDGTDNDDCDERSKTQQLQHVNFFAKEEKDMLQSIVKPPEQKPRGIMPVYLQKKEKSEHTLTAGGNGGGGGGASTDEKLFYQRKRILRKELDDKIKGQMDPMQRFIKPKPNQEESEMHKNTLRRAHIDHSSLLPKPNTKRDDSSQSLSDDPSEDKYRKRHRRHNDRHRRRKEDINRKKRHRHEKEGEGSKEDDSVPCTSRQDTKEDDLSHSSSEDDSSRNRSRKSKKRKRHDRHRRKKEYSRREKKRHRRKEHRSRVDKDKHHSEPNSDIFRRRHTENKKEADLS